MWEAGGQPEVASLGDAGADVLAALRAEHANGAKHEVVRVSGTPRTVVVGLGKAGDGRPETVRRHDALVVALRSLRGRGAKRVAVPVGEATADLVQALADAAVTAGFDAGSYKTGERDEPVQEVILAASGKASQATLEEAVRRGAGIAEGVSFARRLVNTPSNQKSPALLAAEAQRLAKKHNFEIEVLDVPAMRRAGMGALLGVAQGSDQPGRLIHLVYRGGRRPGGAKRSTPGAPVLGVVGKGVTFDSGGISLKPGKDMHLMKTDMSGAAAVLGAFQALSVTRPKIDVHGVIASVENMPSGHSYRPGDVLTAMNGKTIEVLNTDAEGRLILADALCYVQRSGATHLLDLATLTGAVTVALGHGVSGLMGNQTQWSRQVAEACAQSGEPAWELPLVEDYADMLKSLVADLQNIGDGSAGAIIGGLFLREFVDSTPWVHLDIAGTAWNDRETPYPGKGPTGVGVRAIARLAEDLAAGG
jgi:leucyl aminopeptidase